MVTTNENSGSLARKKTKGRRKIEIKKIENVNHRQVTFSKRRTGLFKKASELCILTGAEVTILVQSLGNRVYSFGHPSPNSVIDRFLDGGAKCGEGRQSCPAPKMRDNDRHYSDVCDDLEQEKKRKAVIDEAKKAGAYGGERFWWDEAVEGLELEELKHYAAALEELAKNVTTRADVLMFTQGFNSLPPPTPEGLISVANYDVAASSSDDTTALVTNRNQLSYDFDSGNWTVDYGFGQWQL